jgi:hypothetical protein
VRASVELENKAVNNLISANRKEFNSRLFSSILRIVLIEDFCELLISLQPTSVHNAFIHKKNISQWLGGFRCKNILLACRFLTLGLLLHRLSLSSIAFNLFFAASFRKFLPLARLIQLILTTRKAHSLTLSFHIYLPIFIFALHNFTQ